MSYCLKTGGLILDDAEGWVQECDLHIEGNCVIAYTAGEQQYSYDRADPRIGLVVAQDADPFYRGGSPHGVLVVEQRFCRVRPSLREHINDWYTGYNFQFAGDCE